MMPRKSGIEALRELRAEGVETPALIVSAHQDAGDADSATELEVSGYVTKPIDFDRLFSQHQRVDGVREGFGTSSQPAAFAADVSARDNLRSRPAELPRAGRRELPRPKPHKLFRTRLRRLEWRSGGSSRGRR